VVLVLPGLLAPSDQRAHRARQAVWGSRVAREPSVLLDPLVRPDRLEHRDLTARLDSRDRSVRSETRV